MRQVTIILAIFILVLTLGSAMAETTGDLKYVIKAHEPGEIKPSPLDDAKPKVPTALPLIYQNMAGADGATLGKALRSLYKQVPFNYSILSASLATSTGTRLTTQATSAGMPAVQAPPIGQPSISVTQNGSTQPKEKTLYDIPVNFVYSGNSIDEAVTLLCQAADVYCEKKGGVWNISQMEMYIIDRDVFFSYAIAGGSGSGVGSSVGTPSPTATPSYSGVSQIGGNAASSTSGSPTGTDGVTINGGFDDFVAVFLKPFLSPAGQVQISKGGYIVVVDIPSSVARIRQIITKDVEAGGKARLKIDVISVTLNNDNQAGVNLNAVIKNVAISSAFAPANAFTLAYNTTHKGNPVSTLLGLLGTYGDAKVVQSWELIARSGIPVFFNVVENLPYFTQSQSVTTGISAITTQTNYVTVGLRIKVLPNVRADMLGGGIYAELSEFLGMQSSGGSTPSTAPITKLTNTALPLTLKFGNTLVLTGFKSDSNTATATGVPLLSRIPLLGALFGSQTKNIDRSELVIIVTATDTAIEKAEYKETSKNDTK